LRAAICGWQDLANMTETDSPTDDPFDLLRFVTAQDLVYEQVCEELRSGRKRSHWMWFVFPQIAGLGHSSMAQYFAISGRAEAKAFSEHPVLGARIRECIGLVNAIEGKTAHDIFGSPDDIKFRSSMTLFALCSGDPSVFQAALDKYFDSEMDGLTLSRLSP
jgi:uncharacterized protein (DUF1810 family)